MADLVAPRYAVAGFVPVAYNCRNDENRVSEATGGFKVHQRRELRPWIKVLQVPAR